MITIFGEQYSWIIIVLGIAVPLVAIYFDNQPDKQGGDYMDVELIFRVRGKEGFRARFDYENTTDETLNALKAMAESNLPPTQAIGKGGRHIDAIIKVDGRVLFMREYKNITHEETVEIENALLKGMIELNNAS